MDTDNINIILASCLLDYDLTKKVRPSWLDEDGKMLMEDIIRRAPNYDYKWQYEDWTSLSKKVALYRLDDIWQITEDWRLIAKDLIYRARREFGRAIRQAEDNLKTNDMVETLTKAIEHIKKGERAEGISLAKSMKFAHNSSRLESLSSLVEKVFEVGRGIRTGIKELDSNGGFLRGKLCTLFGDSGHQKTMLSLWLSIMILKANPTFKILYFEKEVPAEDIARRLVSHLLKVDSQVFLRNGLGSENPEEMKVMKEQSLMYKNSAIHKLNTNEGSAAILNRLQIVPSARFTEALEMWEYVDHYQPDVWVLDFATLLNGKGENQELMMKNQFQTLSDMCQNTNSFGIVLSQLKSTEAVDSENRKNKIPTMRDLEWGKVLKQLSSWMFGLFFPSKYDINIDKSWYYMVSRKCRDGIDFTVPLLSNPKYCEFVEPKTYEADEMMKWLKDYQQPQKKVNNYGSM